MTRDHHPQWDSPAHEPADQRDTESQSPYELAETPQPYSVQARSHYGSLYETDDSWGGRSMQRGMRGGAVGVILLMVVGIVFVLGVMGAFFFMIVPM